MELMFDQANTELSEHTLLRLFVTVQEELYCVVLGAKGFGLGHRTIRKYRSLVLSIRCLFLGKGEIPRASPTCKILPSDLSESYQLAHRTVVPSFIPYSYSPFLQELQKESKAKFNVGCGLPSQCPLVPQSVGLQLFHPTQSLLLQPLLGPMGTDLNARLHLVYPSSNT